MSTTSQSASLNKSTGRLESGDHVVTLNEFDLHYRVSGDGPLLFLIPAGWGIVSDYLQRGFKFMQDRFRLAQVVTLGIARYLWLIDATA